MGAHRRQRRQILFNQDHYSNQVWKLHHLLQTLPYREGMPYCNARYGGVSKTIYFVNSDTALECTTWVEPPAWFTDRYKPCHPFELGIKLLQEGTTPYFDQLFFEDNSTNGYAPRATNWKPVALQQLLDCILKHGAYDAMPFPMKLEEYIERATNANKLDIYNCVNQNRDKFQPEMWDRMLYLRELKGYSKPRQLFHHRTQEEIDAEAKGLDE